MSLWIYTNLFPFAILWAMRWHIFVTNWCQNLCMDGKYITYSEVNLPPQLLPLIYFFYQKISGTLCGAYWIPFICQKFCLVFWDNTIDNEASKFSVEWNEFQQIGLANRIVKIYFFKVQLILCSQRLKKLTIKKNKKQSNLPVRLVFLIKTFF